MITSTWQLLTFCYRRAPRSPGARCPGRLGHGPPGFEGYFGRTGALVHSEVCRHTHRSNSSYTHGHQPGPSGASVTTALGQTLHAGTLNQHQISFLTSLRYLEYSPSVKIISCNFSPFSSRYYHRHSLDFFMICIHFDIIMFCDFRLFSIFTVVTLIMYSQYLMYSQYYCNCINYISPLVLHSVFCYLYQPSARRLPS